MRKLAVASGLLGLAVVTYGLMPKSRASHAETARAQVPSKVSPPASARAPAATPASATPASTPSPAAVARAEERKDLRAYFARLNALEICKNGTCPYAKSDQRNYEFERGQDLKKTLAEMAEFARAERLEQSEIAETARKYLANADGHVQEGALDLLSTQVPSPENMHAVLDHVISGYDPQLIEQGMLELGRYGSADDRAKISQALGESMMSGAPFVAREISARIAPFVNSNTLEYFKELAASLPQQSVYRANLEQTLADFAKQNG